MSEWDSPQILAFRRVDLARDSRAACKLPCPDRVGLVNGLFALVDRVQAAYLDASTRVSEYARDLQQAREVNLAYIAELEQVHVSLALVQSRFDRAVKAIETVDPTGAVVRALMMDEELGA